MGLPGFEPGFNGFFVFRSSPELTQTISDSNPKVTLVYLYQATLQPHQLIYKGFGNFANLQISKPRKFSISVWFLLISLNLAHFSAVLKGLWCKKNLF